MGTRWFPFIVFVILVLASMDHEVSAMNCTNVINSTTFHSMLMASKNETWRNEIISIHEHFLQQDGQNPWNEANMKNNASTAAQTEFEWAMLYKSMKMPEMVNEGMAKDKFLVEVGLENVRFDWNSKYGLAQVTNTEYLLMLNVDRLLFSFRTEAGLPNNDTIPYGGWEAPTSELRGHFVGHYMSATAFTYATSKHAFVYRQMTELVRGLDECQKKIGTGYLSAFPTEFFDRFEHLKYVHSPYYTIHKIMTGLLDQYTYAGNQQALKMVVWMTEYFNNRVMNLIRNSTIDQHYLSLNQGTGGMNDVLYRLYSITKNQSHLVLANLFDKPCFLGSLAVKADELEGFHANTHIAPVVGIQNRYELFGEPLFKEMAQYFHHIVSLSHAYATGGTSLNESWTNPKRLGDTLKQETEESSTTYNMLKVTRYLLRWTKSVAYADYYERALINGVLSIQRGSEPGVIIYFLSMKIGGSKAKGYWRWSTPFNSFWSSLGTAIESFAKLGDSIYFEEQDEATLYVIQYVSSTIDWKKGNLQLKQEVMPLTSSDTNLQVSLTIYPNTILTQSTTLKLRVPSWTNQTGLSATLNGNPLPTPTPGTFFAINQLWGRKPNVTIKFPISIRCENIQDERDEFQTVKAFFFGPYLLAGLTEEDWIMKSGNSSSPSDWIIPIPQSYKDELVSLSQSIGSMDFFIMKSDNNLVKKSLPKQGSVEAMHATFRIGHLVSTLSDVHPEESLVYIEPFGFPGALVEHQGPNGTLTISRTPGNRSIFKVITWFHDKYNTISLASKSHPNCFIYSEVNYIDGESLKLICNEDWKFNDKFREAISFIRNMPLREYNPISFLANGVNNKFLLEPLMSLQDENYSVYFNVTA
ncbi:Beta-L-arabinofuranosidase GH127 protein [Dioscorea alata]|uniref:Beta-L-arabinofuranosidase GH127 protein n=1 Tax=Dioscorea alata TaxID=55571 RepID=A0ACB7VJ64_DIOAL|nr:Beta-L-arabinofuranosidase GH127 protein [Dioscorea alata]